MALLSTLTFKDITNEFNVLDFRCHFSRRYNHFNPESTPFCERIEMTVVAPETDDYTIYEWYINRNLMSGKLTYKLPVTLKSSGEDRLIDFYDAQCFSISENYDINEKKKRLLKIVIIPEKVSMQNVSFSHL
jgi:hypothetical protein